MKIIIEDFNYKGHHFKKYECEMPTIKDVNDVPEEKIVEYVCESLDTFLKEEEL